MSEPTPPMRQANEVISRLVIILFLAWLLGGFVLGAVMLKAVLERLG